MTSGIATSGDGILIQLALAGQTECFAILIDRHKEAVTKRIRSMIRNKTDEDDLVQDVFLKAWRHLASLIGHWALRDFGVYAVASSAATGELQGVVGLWEPYDWPCREFVYWFTADAYASGRALAAARLQLGLVRAARRPGEIITTYIHPENELGLSLAHQLGGISRGEEPLFDFGQHVRVEYAD